MVDIFVEGGGGKRLGLSCRRAFTLFLQNAGMRCKFNVVPCGGRSNAYDDFKDAVKSGQTAWLLVDSESAVKDQCMPEAEDPEKWLPWLHLKSRKEDGWDKPKGVEDTQCHMMVIKMEYWLVADPDALKKHFGSNFNEKSLPKTVNIETLDAKRLDDALNKSTQKSGKGKYSKGRDSFAVLGLVDPKKVAARAPWADRLVQIAKKM